MPESSQQTRPVDTGAQKGFLDELEPVAAQLLETHLENAEAHEWFPHEMVPWDRARNFVPKEGCEQSDIEFDPEVRSSLFVNLLTEDNLPYYFRTIERKFGPDSAWGTWVRRWTAEEGRHSIVLRDYLTVSRAVDLRQLERARMAQVQGGQTPEPDTPQDAIVYVTLQELATRVSHFNTGVALKKVDEDGYEIMKKVASDENRHYLFYRGLGTAALEIDPSGMVLAIERQVHEFEMPGTGIVDFGTHAHAIANAGIYDFDIHYKKVLAPVIFKHWDLEHLENLTPEADKARASVITRIERIGRAGRRFASRRDEVKAKIV